MKDAEEITRDFLRWAEISRGYRRSASRESNMGISKYEVAKGYTFMSDS
jgi:hypothetical protein